ncbi:MAG: carbon-nitrogen hydrolase family protein [Clostridiaceae bacterium]|nr:carbon-nitrogen hydrolase family protein [Clostridiaceae bacterium]
MRIGVYQFPSSCDINDNLEHIKAGITKAAIENVDLLVFHECALCGYPPIETEIDRIEKSEIEHVLCHISRLASENRMNIALGTVFFDDGKRYNSVVLFGKDGSILGRYDKKALWGWDTRNFEPGNKAGIFDIEGIKTGFRICFDIRFPELFRELYAAGTELCFVCFSDTEKKEDPARYNILKAHLITRAVENVMTIVSVDSTTDFQTAPTIIINHNGRVIAEANIGDEQLVIYDYERPEISFGMRGRIENSRRFMEKD